MAASMTEGENSILKLPTNEPILEKDTEFKAEIRWKNAIFFIILHILAVYGAFVIPHAKWGTIIVSFMFGLFSGLGVTAGVHRLWTHKSYKARLPLQLFLLWSFTMSAQNDAIEWCRDHRVHHKFSETNADPHNSKRGFFFAHMGWLMCKKHPDVKTKGKTVDIRDLENHPLLKLQRKYYVLLILVCTIGIPTLLPIFLFQEKIIYAFLIGAIFRTTYVFHITWLVNSAAHLFGNRPYDKTIDPRENMFVKFLSLGEGYHNYHHTFPWDYSTSELGLKPNFTTAFINLMAYFGLAYDLKTTDSKLVQARVKRTGEHQK